MATKAAPAKASHGKAAQVKVFKLDGTPKGTTTLPAPFAAPQRPDLVLKAVNVSRKSRRQPYGNSPIAARMVTHRSWGPGQGASRVPRGTQRSIAVFGPNVVGGRRAHPPRVEKVMARKINKSERRVALRAALAAAADVEAVRARGHKFDLEATPLVVEDAFLDVDKTDAVLEALVKLKVATDVTRAKDGTHQRAGRGKMRGRRYRTPTSLLIVVHQAGPLVKACRNLAGVDVSTVDQLNVERLAPGGHPGRLTLFTESALKMVGEVAK